MPGQMSSWRTLADRRIEVMGINKGSQLAGPPSFPFAFFLISASRMAIKRKSNGLSVETPSVPAEPDQLVISIDKLHELCYTAFATGVVACTDAETRSKAPKGVYDPQTRRMTCTQCQQPMTMRNCLDCLVTPHRQAFSDYFQEPLGLYGAQPKSFTGFRQLDLTEYTTPFAASASSSATQPLPKQVPPPVSIAATASTLSDSDVEIIETRSSPTKAPAVQKAMPDQLHHVSPRVRKDINYARIKITDDATGAVEAVDSKGFQELTRESPRKRARPEAPTPKPTPKKPVASRSNKATDKPPVPSSPQKESVVTSPKKRVLMAPLLTPSQTSPDDIKKAVSRALNNISMIRLSPSETALDVTDLFTACHNYNYLQAGRRSIVAPLRLLDDDLSAIQLFDSMVQDLSISHGVVCFWYDSSNDTAHVFSCRATILINVITVTITHYSTGPKSPNFDNAKQALEKHLTTWINRRYVSSLKPSRVVTWVWNDVDFNEKFNHLLPIGSHRRTILLLLLMTQYFRESTVPKNADELKPDLSALCTTFENMFNSYLNRPSPRCS